LAVRVITEAALLGGVLAQAIWDNLRILSDGAGQLNLSHHDLCWVHAERALQRLAGSTAQHRQNIAEMQDLWRQARNTLVGLKKTCRKLGISFWQYLLFRVHGDYRISPLPDVDVIRAKEVGQQVAVAA
jgi:hypothetical protein